MTLQRVNNGSAATTTPTHNQLVAKAQEQLDRFSGALVDVLNDITALEVNTMIVSRITGAKFVPEEAYENLFEVLEHEEANYDRIKHSFVRACEECMRRLSIPSAGQVPDPYVDRANVQQMLADSEFLRTLRKLNELKSLSVAAATNQGSLVDIIYAQTVIQIDGDIINRFHEQLLWTEMSPEAKNFLIQVHREAVLSGEENWRGLLKFMLDLVKDIGKGVLGGGSSQNGRS
jgi:hypothetical protein